MFTKIKKITLQFCFLTILFSITSLLSFGQEITVEKIWKKYEFYAKGVDGFRSMNDGNYYTQITEDNGKQSITKHSIIDDSKKMPTFLRWAVVCKSV